MDSSRTPKNLQDLLKFAINQQSDANDNASHELDEDKRNFLDNVLNSMTVDVIEELLKAIRILNNEQSSDEEKCDALDIIREYIDNIDFANNFIKIDGAEILMKCVKSANTDIKVNSINIIAEMSQNNPFCQKYFLDCGVIKLLDLHLSKDQEDKVVASALYALSGSIVNFEPALAEFKKIDGLKHIINCLNSKCSRVITKACFLISSISSEFSLVRDEFATLKAFEMLSKNLEIVNDYDTKTELLLAAMVELLKSPKCNPDPKVKKNVAEILRNIIKQNKSLPQCEEIVSHSEIILEHIERR